MGGPTNTGVVCDIHTEECGIPAISEGNNARYYMIPVGFIVGLILWSIIGIIVWRYIIKKQSEQFARAQAKRRDLDKLLGVNDFKKHQQQTDDYGSDEEKQHMLQNNQKSEYLEQQLIEFRQTQQNQVVPLSVSSTRPGTSSGIDSSHLEIARQVKLEVDKIANAAAASRESRYNIHHHNNRLTALENYGASDIKRPGNEHFVRAHFFHPEPDANSHLDYRWARNVDGKIDLTTPQHQSLLLPSYQNNPNSIMNNITEKPKQIELHPSLANHDSTFQQEQIKGQIGYFNDKGQVQDSRLPLFTSGQLLHLLLAPLSEADQSMQQCLSSAAKTDIIPISDELENETDVIARSIISTVSQQMDSFEYFHLKHAAETHNNIGNIARLHLKEHAKLLRDHDTQKREIISQRRDTLEQQVQEMIRNKSPEEVNEICASFDDQLENTVQSLHEQAAAQRSALQDAQTARGQHLTTDLKQSHDDGIENLLQQSRQQLLEMGISLDNVGHIKSVNPVISMMRNVLATQLERTLQYIKDLSVEQVESYANELKDIRKIYETKFGEKQKGLAEEEYRLVQSHENKYSELMKEKYDDLAHQVERAKANFVSKEEIQKLLEDGQTDLQQFANELSLRKQNEANQLREHLKVERAAVEKALSDEHDIDLKKCRRQAYITSIQHYMVQYYVKFDKDLLVHHEESHNDELDKRFDELDRNVKSKKAQGVASADIKAYVDAKQAELNAYAAELQKNKDLSFEQLKARVEDAKEDKKILLQEMLSPYQSYLHPEAVNQWDATL